MSVRVLVNGADGRMGRLVVQSLHTDSGLKLVAETGRNDNLAQAIQASKAQVVVDFTNATVVFENITTILAAGAYPVIGTSGLKTEQVTGLQKNCAEQGRGGIIAPNFCISALLMMRFAEQAAAFFPEVEILEVHHEKKLDAPSGTALKTADLIAAARKVEPSTKSLHETVPGSRGALQQQIPIHALRLPGFLAKQEVIFGHVGGNLRIVHETIDRSAYMPGVLLACKKVTALEQLIYGLEYLL